MKWLKKHENHHFLYGSIHRKSSIFFLRVKLFFPGCFHHQVGQITSDLNEILFFRISIKSSISCQLKIWIWGLKKYSTWLEGGPSRHGKGLPAIATAAVAETVCFYRVSASCRSSHTAITATTMPALLKRDSRGSCESEPPDHISWYWVCWINWSTPVDHLSWCGNAGKHIHVAGRGWYDYRKSMIFKGPWWS